MFTREAMIAVTSANVAQYYVMVDLIGILQIFNIHQRNVKSIELLL